MFRSIFTCSVRLNILKSLPSHSVCKQVQSAPVKLVNIFILLICFYTFLSVCTCIEYQVNKMLRF